MPPRRRRRAALALAAALAAVPVLAGCAAVQVTSVHLQPAARADTVACADVVVHLPTSVESETVRETNAQGTSAWGSPTSIVLTCGITTPAVSDLPCNTVEGVDWLAEFTPSKAVFTTYGRSPGVQVVVDTKAVEAPTNVLHDVSSAVGTLPQNRACQSPSDATPAP